MNILYNTTKREVRDAKQTKSDLKFSEEIVMSKEEHIERLYMFIEYICVNFRNEKYEKYEEIDIALRKINL